MLLAAARLLYCLPSLGKQKKLLAKSVYRQVFDDEDDDEGHDNSVID